MHGVPFNLDADKNYEKTENIFVWTLNQVKFQKSIVTSDESESLYL